MDLLAPHSRSLGTAGGVLLAAWALLGGLFSAPGWTLWASGVPGALLAGFALWLERAAVRKLVLAPQMRVGGNAVVFSAGVVAVVALLNVIATRHSWRQDVTADRFFSLSDQTVKVLAALPRKIKATVFTNQASPESGQIKDLLEQYRHHGKNLELEFVDADQKPERALLYKINAYNTVVLETEGGRRKDILAHEMFGYGGMAGMGGQPKREFKGESVLTAALLSMASDRQQTVYFLEGHGERSVLDTTEKGVSELKAGLERDNFVVKTLSLIREGKIPEDADLLVTSGPEKALLPGEAKIIAGWLSGRGRLLVLLNARSGAAGLDAVLKPYGVTVQKGWAADPRQYYSEAGPLVPIPTYAPHVITDGLRSEGVGVLFPLAFGLVATAGEQGVATALLTTTDEGWLETTMSLTSAPKYNAGADKAGPITLAAAVTVAPAVTATSAADDPEPGEPQPKIVVFASVEWIQNGAGRSSLGNLDLFANTINWLTGSSQRISIRPKEREERRIFFTNVKTKVMGWTTIVFIPLAVLAAGALRWWRRRSL